MPIRRREKFASEAAARPGFGPRKIREGGRRLRLAPRKIRQPTPQACAMAPPIRGMTPQVPGMQLIKMMVTKDKFDPEPSEPLNPRKDTYEVDVAGAAARGSVSEGAGPRS